MNEISNHHSLSNNEDKERIEMIKCLCLQRIGQTMIIEKKSCQIKSERLQTTQLEHLPKSNLEEKVTDFNLVFHQ